MKVSKKVKKVMKLWKKFPFVKFSTKGFKSYVVKVINWNRPHTEDVFPVVANTRTKSIQKQIKSKCPD